MKPAVPRWLRAFGEWNERIWRSIDRNIDGWVWNPTVNRTLYIAAGLMLALTVAVQIGMRWMR